MPEKVRAGLSPKGGDSRVAYPGRWTSTCNLGLEGKAGLAHLVSCKLFSTKGEKRTREKVAQNGPRGTGLDSEEV